MAPKCLKEQSQTETEMALSYANNIISTLREPFLVMNKKLRIISANKSFYTTFKVTEKETIGQTLSKLGNNQWNIPKLIHLLKEILQKKIAVTNYEVDHKFKTIGHRTMNLNASQIRIPKNVAKLLTRDDEDNDEELILLSIEDITEDKYHSLFSEARDAIMTLEPPTWRFTDGNPATLKMFKAKNQAEFVACEPWRLSPKRQPDGRLSSEKAKEMIEKGSNFFEWVHKRLNGEEFFANVRLSKLERGKNSFLHAEVRDISEDKRIENERKESEELFKNIFNEAGDGILLAEIKSKKFYMANKTMSRMLGYSLKEIKHLGVSDIHKKKDLPYVISQFEKQAKGKIDMAHNIPIKKKNGSIFYADIRATKVKIAKKPYIMGFFHDITEHRKLEQALEAIKEAKEKTILASIGDGLMACDINGKITLFNDVLAELSGFPTKEAIGKHYQQVISLVVEDTNKPAQDFIAQTIQEGKTNSRSNHAMIIKKDGTRIAVTYKASPIFDKYFKSNGCVVIFRDFSDERKIDRAKTEFVSLASHQLRTPLTSINWIIEQFSNKSYGEITPKQESALRTLSSSSHHMTDLVNTLLKVSLIDLGTFVIKPITTDISTLANEVLSDLSMEAKIKNLKLLKRFQTTPKIKADPVIIRIIWQNLISNAIHYSPFRGKIKIGIKKHKKDLLLSVADEGIGIPEKEHDNIFNKLYRASNAEKNDTGGSGLGLYIIKSILDNSGGKIWFDSNKNKGTTFYVTIPLSGMTSK